MRAIPIDSFFEDLEDQAVPTAGRAASRARSYDWARIVTEGKSARDAADGGRWRIGELAVMVERRYRSGALQRFSAEIGESYPTVRRYRWVARAYEPGARHRFPSLSFSHFQAVAGHPDRVLWLERAARGSWAVDRLTRESRSGDTRATKEDPFSALERLRTSIEGLQRRISPAASLDDAAIARAGKEWLTETLNELTKCIDQLRERLRRANVAAGRSNGTRARAVALKARAVGR